MIIDRKDIQQGTTSTQHHLGNANAFLPIHLMWPPRLLRLRPQRQRSILSRRVRARPYTQAFGTRHEPSFTLEIRSQRQQITLRLGRSPLIHLRRITRAVIQIQPHKRERQAKRLYLRDGLAEPDDCKDDDEDALDQAGDGVGDG